jgi:hypothetical protein
MDHLDNLHGAVIHGEPGVARASANSALNTGKYFLASRRFLYFFQE